MDPEVVFETRALYEAFRKTGGDRPGHADPAHVCVRSEALGITVRRVVFESRSTDALREDDRAIAENHAFDVPLFRAETPATRDERVVVVLHGLNETLYNKLFPWAASLARILHAPVALFPMALHLTRRPHAWIERGRTLFAERASLARNTHASPFNSVLSARLDEAPERFIRAGLQTYGDLARFADLARAGEIPGVSSGARVDFVGYSAGGYTALATLACDNAGRFSRSRAVLFAAGADGAGVHTESLFILDARASETMRRAYGMTGGALDTAVSALTERSDPARFVCALLAGRGEASAELARVADRVCALSLARDAVIDAPSMARALAPIAVHTIDAGSHEYPFSIEGPTAREYSPSVGRRLFVDVSRSSDVAPRFARAFSAFISRVAEHLRD